MNMNEDELLTAKEALAVLKVHRQTLWRLEQSGAVQPVRIGTVKRYKATEILGQKKIK